MSEYNGDAKERVIDSIREEVNQDHLWLTTKHLSGSLFPMMTTITIRVVPEMTSV